MKHATWLLLLLTGCTTMRGRADSAYSKGNYLEAIAIDDQILREHPNDAAASKHRSAARNAELRVEVKSVQQARVAGKMTVTTGLLGQLRAPRWLGWSARARGGAGDYQVSWISARIGGEVAERTSSEGHLQASMPRAPMPSFSHLVIRDDPDCPAVATRRGGPRPM